MKYSLNLEELKNIYLISNTAPFLIEKFKNDISLQYLRDAESISDLIDEFKAISKAEINSMEDVVYAYALYIAILLKRDDKVLEEFLKNEGNIKFEWFPEIKNIYFEKLRPTTISYIPLSPKVSNKNSHNNIRATSNDSEFQEIDIVC